MGGNSIIVSLLLLVTAIAVFTIFGPGIIVAAVIFFILAAIVMESRKNQFGSVTDIVNRDRRFELRKGQSVFIKNYGTTVRFSGLTSPGMSVEAHKSRTLELTVEQNTRTKSLHFDSDNRRASRTQHAFGVRFILLDFRNGTAVFSADRK